MRLMRKTPLALGAAALLLAAAVVGLSGMGGKARADAGSMDAMRIDMNPNGAPANTATSLGSNETCARINENGTLDADEDATADTVTVDVTAKDIPVSNPMIGFSYWLEHDQSALTVQSEDANFLLSNTPGSSLFVLSNATPDSEAPADNVWKSDALDLGAAAGETGSGVLDRITISTDAGVATGDYQLSLSSAVHLDAVGADAHMPNNATADSNGDTLLDKVPNVAKISVNKDCTGGGTTSTPTVTPTPTPTPAGTPSATPGPPTATPTATPPGETPGPTPTGTPGVIVKGDNDCDGDVDTVDALKGLRHVAALDVAQNEPCTDLGSDDPVMGDMDCDGDVDSVDAMRILRHVAGLPNSLPDGCPLIGV